MVPLPQGELALVAGAGIAGLAAAAALSPFFRQVTVYDKDRLPPHAVPRKGVAQGQHVHVFLIGGLSSLECLLPGTCDDLRAAGAIPVDLGRDLDMFDHGKRRPRRMLGMELVCLSRPAYEHVVRRRVASLPNVRFKEGVKVRGIAFASGQAIGLDLGNMTVPADFVVDATGRGGSLAGQLAHEGYGKTPETSIGIDMCYSSGRFRLSPRWRYGAAAMCVPAPPDKRYGVLLPIEQDQCIVSLGGRCGVEPPADLDGFLDYSQRLACPALSERIADGELLGSIRRYRKPTANWRHYEALGAFPRRFAPAGDTIASFNPTYGQGMTVAVRHALALREALIECGADSRDFAARYLAAAAAVSAAAWNGAALVDLAYPEVTGARPPGFEQTLAFLHGLRLVSDTDAEVNRLEYEVLHMTKPAAALQDGALAARVHAALGAPVAIG